ncbi:MAG: tetratricopeptide repeat protein, partial [Deltaproteobacteria bacterium]|nr:tetratricopeptide repeat protein [Deltaproteobacteria bacterium]
LAAAVKDLRSAILETKGKYPQAMATLAEVHITRADKANRQISKLDSEITALEKQINDKKPKDGKEPDEKIKAEITPLHNKKVDLQRARMKVVDSARKDLEEAKRQIDGAQALAPKALAPKRALANYMRVMSNERAPVEATLAEAAAIAKDDPELLFIDGATLALDAASYEAAAQKLSQAIELQIKAQKPDLVRARYKLSEILVALKRPDQAKQQLERILISSPNHLEAKALAESLAAKPEPEPEEKKPAEPGMPTSYQGWMTLANGLQQKGRTKKALTAYDAALELKAEDAAALTGKGLCFLDNGSNSAAINWFKRAIKSNSRYADAIMGLAESYKYQGNKLKAVVYYQRYVDAFPHGPEASVAKRNLKELK